MPISRKDESRDIAQNGQRAARDGVAIVPHLYSSPDWLLFMAGKQIPNASAIVAAKVSRGYSVKLQTAANSYLVTFDKHDLHRITVDRLA